MKMLQTIAAAAIFAGCASGPQFYSNPLPVDMSPQAIMAGKTCSDLPVDHTPSVNAPGWVVVPTREMSCGGRYASGAFRCDNPAKCMPLVFQPSPPTDPTDRGRTWHIIVDGVGGDFGACAQPSNRFAVQGHIDCVPIEFHGVTRAVLPVVVPPLVTGAGLGSEQTATTVEVVVYPRGQAPVILGQIGPAESPTEPLAPARK